MNQRKAILYGLRVRETPEEVNERYRLGRGAKKLGRKAAAAATEPTADDANE